MRLEVLCSLLFLFLILFSPTGSRCVASLLRRRPVNRGARLDRARSPKRRNGTPGPHRAELGQRFAKARDKFNSQAFGRRRPNLGLVLALSDPERGMGWKDDCATSRR